MFTLEDGREHLYQWDLDRRVRVSDPTIGEVHFCNRTSDCSLVVKTYTDDTYDGQVYADIPNILLQDARPIRVYAYVDDKFTLTEEQIAVKSRTRPRDYVYKETDVIRWEKIAENAEKAVTEATTAATLATDTANDLYEYVEGHKLQFTDDEAGNVTLEGVQTGEDINLDNYATKEYVNNAVAEIDIPTVPTNVSAFTNDAGYLTEHQSLEGYAKTSDIPDTSSFTTMAAVEAKGYQTADDVTTLINNSLGVIENGSY